MTLPAKLSLGFVVVGGVSLAGCYAGGVFNENPWVSLKKAGTGDEVATTKIGGAYGIYLLAVNGDAKNPDMNEAWWKALYKKYEADKANTTVLGNMSTDFGGDKVASAYEKKPAAGVTATDGSKALNKVCEEAYKKDKANNIEFVSSPTEDKHKLGRDLFRYCSLLGKKPSTVKENKDTYESSKIGGTDANKEHLASTSDPDNYYFWEAQERWFAEEAAAQANEYFKKYFDGDNSNKKLNTKLKDICHTAYGLSSAETATSTSPKLDDVKKYCNFRDITAS